MAKRYRKKDPHFKREAKTYQHPVASREHILQYLQELGVPCDESDMAAALSIAGENEEEGLRRRLKAMCRDGELMQNRTGKFALIKEMDMVSGRVQAHRDGYGFLLAEDGREDIFLSARQMRGLFNEDRVVVRVTQRKKGARAEGILVEILERGTAVVVGRYLEEDGTSFVEPHNRNMTQDILIPKKMTAKAKVGDYVVVEITVQPHKRRQPMGKIKRILGNELTPGLEVELAIQAHQIPFEWPKKVLAAAKRFGDSPSKKDCKNRVDLRHSPFVTIDGEDARDYDDAIYCSAKDGGGWQLQVAIADVSYYVEVDSQLDVAAQERGNSVYFPSCVMPMLPESLSNGLCSLCPQQDRLAMVCDMQIDSHGELEDYRFYEAVICSHARLTYKQVAKMLQDKMLPDKLKEDKKVNNRSLLAHMQTFECLFQQLLKVRQTRGAIEFETTETKVLFTEQGKIAQIVPTVRTVAHRMIEEAMLLTNICAATMMSGADCEGIYRIHEPPEEERLDDLREFLHGFGLRLGGGKKPHALDYAKLISRISKRVDAHLLQTVLLRSMQRAVYSSEDKGHFALSYDSYAHFTSPIRRYPDLMVHRIIKSLLKVKKGAHCYPQSTINTLTDHMSMTERRADLATRDALDWLKCHFMIDKVGKNYSGLICDVTSFGIFVELTDTYVHGLIHISTLPGDYYAYDAAGHCLRGRRSGRIFRLGDSLDVIISRVDIDKRQIDFDLQ